MGVLKCCLYVIRLSYWIVIQPRPNQGQFQQSLPPGTVMGATKWCLFRPINPTRAVVEAAVAERMQRMQTNCVDLLQV